MKTWQHVLLGVLLGLILGAVIYLVAVPPQGTPIYLHDAPTPSPLIIDISGAVISPGVYILPRESRVQDAIVAAGGFSSSADQSKINLAHFIRDGEKIYIPQIGEAIPEIPSNIEEQNTALSTEYPINLNTAFAEDLEMLPGIGESRAKDIISYREQNGPFLSIEEIQKVPGIGPGIFENIRSLITVSD